MKENGFTNKRAVDPPTQIEDFLTQGFSGSVVTRDGNFLIKDTSDADFVSSKERQTALPALTARLNILPTIFEITGSRIKMEYVSGAEGITAGNALQTGINLRILHAQTSYPFPISTGTKWLCEKALHACPHKAEDISSAAGGESVDDYVLIHGEPVQVIARPNGDVVFIDIEGIGMGSKYQDLGFVYYIAALGGQMGIYSRLVDGYGKDDLDISKVRHFAGIISLAYSSFVDAEKRIELGCSLLQK